MNPAARDILMAVDNDPAYAQLQSNGNGLDQESGLLTRCVTSEGRVAKSSLIIEVPRQVEDTRSVEDQAVGVDGGASCWIPAKAIAADLPGPEELTAWTELGHEEVCGPALVRQVGLAECALDRLVDHLRCSGPIVP